MPAPGAPSSAHLMIHGTEGVRSDGEMFGRVLLLWHALGAGRTRRQPNGPTRVRIADLQGRQFFACDDVRSLIDLRLPAGTYHITVGQGHPQRRYTVTLERGTAFDLYLRRPTQSH